MKNIKVFSYLNIFQFLEVKFSTYLNWRVFVMHVRPLLVLPKIGLISGAVIIMNIEQNSR